MTDQQMPEDGAKPFSVRRDALGGDARDENAEASGLASESAVAAHDAEDVSARGGGSFDSPHDVHGDILFAVTAADREDQHGVARADARPFEPGREAGFPPIVVGARGELGNVVGGCVRFESAKLAKVIHRMAGMSG